MNRISSLFDGEKPLQTKKLFVAGNTTVIAIRISRGGQLKEHITPDPAILICLNGTTNYADKNGKKVRLGPGDFVHIEPDVRHWLDGISDSELILVRS